MVSKQKVENVQIKLLDKDIKKVKHFKYLGSWLNVNINPDKEIKVRLVLARNTFSSWIKVLPTKEQASLTELKILNFYV